MSVDERWYRDVNPFARDTSWLHAVLSAYALWAALVVLALMLVVAFLVSRHRRGRGADGRGPGLRRGRGHRGAADKSAPNFTFVARARSCHTLGHVEVLLTCANDYSFPSDHCMMAGVFVAGLAFVGVRWAVPAAVLAVLLAFTRVYTGVHYPSDAAAGLVIGAVIGAMAVLVLRPSADRLTSWLASTRARGVVSAPGCEPARAEAGAAGG